MIAIYALIYFLMTLWNASVALIGLMYALIVVPLQELWRITDLRGGIIVYYLLMLMLIYALLIWLPLRA